MIERKNDRWSLVGPGGSLPVNPQDDVTVKLAMLFDGHCLGLGASRAAAKYGFSRQRYYQLLRLYRQGGALALGKAKRGPKSNYRRSDEVVRQVIRYRYLDPGVSPEVIAQKLRLNGFAISTRSVNRVIADYGLQKKTPSLLAQAAGPLCGSASDQA